AAPATPGSPRSGARATAGAASARRRGRPRAKPAPTREPAERRAGETGEDPLLAELRPEPPVEPDRRRVPVEYHPFHSAAPAPQGDPRQLGEQRPAGAPPALFGQDEEILEVERRTSHKRRVREEVEGEAAGGAAPPADEGLEVGPPPEAVAADLHGGGLHPASDRRGPGDPADRAH